MDRQVVKIITVDPAQRIVEGVLRGRSTTPIEVREIPVAFRWPEVGESWMVHRHGVGSWQLGHRLEMGAQETPIETLEQGQLKLSADEVLDGAGRHLLAVSGPNQLRMGSGIPTRPEGADPTQGDFYFRTDTPSTSNQRLYVCTVGGASPTWVGIL